MRNTQDDYTRQRGFSLIELLVTMAIAVILLTIGVPSFIDMMSSNTAASYGNDLLTDLNYARSEAITRGVTVTVCHSNVAATCSGTWSDGWIVFANTNTAGTDNVVDPGDEMLRTHAMVNTSGWALNANNVTDYVTYKNSGLSNQAVIFVFCKGNVLNVGNQTRSAAVSVNQTGRAHVLPYNANGVPLDDTGNALATCTP